MLVTDRTNLTAAEALAVYQVLYEGGQTIDIGSKGNAVGGNVSLSGALGQEVKSITVSTVIPPAGGGVGEALGGGPGPAGVPGTPGGASGSAGSIGSSGTVTP